MVLIFEPSAFNHPYLYLYILSFIFSLIIVYKTVKTSKYKKKYNLFFILCNIALGSWAFLIIFQLLLSPTINHIYIYAIILLASTISVWCLMMFIYYYTNTSISSRIAWGSLIPLSICYMATLVDFYVNIGLYDMYVESGNVSFYTIPYEQSLTLQILIIMHFIYGIIGLGVLYIYSRNQKDKNRKQYYLIILAIIIILGGALISVFRLDFYPNIDVYPAFFSLFFIIIWLSINKYGFLEILPVSRTKILDNLEQSVILINSDCKIIDCNKSAKKLTDRQDLFKNDIYYIFPIFQDKIENFEEKVILEEININEKYYDISITPLYDNSSVYSGSIISFEDVTRLKESQTLLKEQKIDLKSQNEKLEDFASILAHDIRNPLHVAKGYSELLYKEPDNQENYEKLNDSLDRIDSIIQDVREMTKKGKRVNETVEVDLNSIVKESWGMLQFEDATLNINQTIKFKADKSRLKTVLENLFRNSIDHAPDDKETEVNVGPLSNNKGFYIEDNGSGIPDDEKDNIFNYGMTKSEDGTGIGLAVVEQIVKAHGWEINVKDGEELSGARFEILFDNK